MSKSSGWRPTRGQLVRVSIAVVLLTAGGILLYPQIESDIRSNGTVNARLVTVTSPIDGRVMLDMPEVGGSVLEDQLLTQIGDNPDAVPLLAQLDTDRTAAQATLLALQGQLETLQDLRARLEQEVSAYQDRSVERIRHELAEASARVRLWQATREERAAGLARMRELARKGHAPAAKVEAAVSLERQATQEIERARADVARLEAEADAAGQGVFLGEGRNDVPYSRQRLDEVLINAARIEQEVAVARAKLTALDRQYEIESERARRRADADVYAPLNGLIWRRLAEPGTAVGRGTELAEILDCSTLTIQVPVPETRADRLAPDAEVEVRLQGSGRRLPAEVVSIRGMQSVVRQQEMAASPPKLDRDEVMVTVVLGPSSLGVRPGTFCGVGRRAQVIFPGRLSAWTDALFGEGREVADAGGER